MLINCFFVKIYIKNWISEYTPPLTISNRKRTRFDDKHYNRAKRKRRIEPDENDGCPLMSLGRSDKNISDNINHCIAPRRLSEFDKHKQIIENAFSPSGSRDDVLIVKFNLSITRRDIMTLTNLNWLNDQIINFYMNLITERGKNEKWPKTYTMNTFFYPKLMKDGPQSLKRWTKEVDIFSYDLIAVPIHLDTHWCMSMIDFRQKTMKYYDSLSETNHKVLPALMDYLKQEHRDKRGEDFNSDGWKIEMACDIPHQTNVDDCGTFSCTFAEYLSRDAQLSFRQEDMPYLRRKMAIEILRGELLIVDCLNK